MVGENHESNASWVLIHGDVIFSRFRSGGSGGNDVTWLGSDAEPLTTARLSFLNHHGAVHSFCT